MAVASSPTHDFSKTRLASVQVREGLGVVGDAHAGRSVKHRSRVRADPSQPNLRQVHLLHAELFDELAQAGFDVGPADLGENVTTHGIDLLGLPRGARLHLGDEVVLEVTGLRSPCQQVNDFRSGLVKRLVVPDGEGGVVRKIGIMSVVARGGTLTVDDGIEVELPAGAHHRLEPV